MVQQKFVELQKQLNHYHIERYDEVQLASVALLSKYHIVLIGPPGTAKSMLAEDLVNVFQGAKLFKYLLGKFTNPEELFGPWNIPLLEQGKYERITTNKMPDAHIAFLDEFFKANSAIQNSQLTILNERVFDNGTERQPVPLMTLFAASNEMPEGEELWALFDRFHFRKIVTYIQEPGNFIKMLRQPDIREYPDMSISDLWQAQEEVADISVGDHVYDSLTEIRGALQMQGIEPSDRRFRQSVRALQASAYLAGRDAVSDDDYDVLTHMYWSAPQEIKTVQRVILSNTNPIDLKAQEIIDTCDEIAGQLRSALSDAKAKGLDPQDHLNKAGLEWFNKCRQLGKDLKKLEGQAKSLNRNMNRIKQAHARIMSVAGDIGREIIGIDPTNMQLG